MAAYAYRRDPARPPPLKEQAYNRLRTDILYGRIQPNERLKIELLQKQYDLSSSPLREALSRMTAEGLVIADERRGFRAVPISIDDYRDLTEFRLTIEEGALTESIEHGDEDWEAGIVAAFHLLEPNDRNTGARLHDEKWSQLHKRFHMALLSGTRSQRLRAACSTALDEAERYRCLFSRRNIQPRHHHDEHKRLMQAVLERDAEKARTLHRSHVMKTTENIIRVMTQDIEADSAKPERGRPAKQQKTQR